MVIKIKLRYVKAIFDIFAVERECSVMSLVKSYNSFCTLIKRVKQTLCYKL